MSAVRPAVLLLALAVLCASAGCRGQHEGPGTIEGRALPAEAVAAREQQRSAAAVAIAGAAGAPAPARQILFGDLHVHSTISADAFMMSLPILQGEGSHPVADACDYARYCSGLDFWSINDHAESITPRRWRETADTIRQCNALAGDAENPDVVAYLGWEWTQVGQTPAEHYGHKNVILRDLDADHVPRRPIDSASFTAQAMRTRIPWEQRYAVPLLDWPNRQRYFDLVTFMEETQSTPRCPDGVDTRELPDDCMEGAATPDVLFEKLAQWGHESLVIPHGTTWGIYTPQGSTWDKQLVGAMHDPERQRVIEVHSGHGNSEEYRDWRAVEFDAAGNAVCPDPTDEFEPCCWRAGQIIRERCEAAGEPDCDARAEEAERNFLAAGAAGAATVPGATVEDWLGCGQCHDCFLPAYRLRPGSSVQAITALGNFDAPGDPRRFRFGFIASSDNHSARPGTGYKEYGRLFNTEARGPRNEAWYRRWTEPVARDPEPRSLPPEEALAGVPPYLALDFERQASFFVTGGLAAVHADGRSREAIWDALRRREVYGTSGPRILLWFDLLNGPAGEQPMGSEAALGEAPRFRVRAVGSFVQQPGCPELSRQGLSAERLERLCRGECDHPGDVRHPIVRVEVVRIRPQMRPGEPIGTLVEDPWLVLPCDGDPAGCTVTFEDPELPASGRPATYYVRAIQPETPAVNAANLRCTFDEDGRCVEVDPCHGDYRTPPDDDCLAPAEERAWSSPIFVAPVVAR